MAAGTVDRTVAVKGCRWVEQTVDDRVVTTAEMRAYLMVVTTACKTASPWVDMTEMSSGGKMADSKERVMVAKTVDMMGLP